MIPGEATQSNGYVLGRPDGRDTEPMDQIIIDTIESFPAASRLYPDVWAWRVSEALKEAGYGKQTEDPVLGGDEALRERPEVA